MLAVSFVNSSGRMIVADRLPIDRSGKRLVRITEGTATGKVVEIPTRNLRPVGDEASEQPAAKQAPDPARRAATLLSTGRNLEKLKKPGAAVETYRRILSDYPASSEAKAAAARIQALEGR